MLTYITETGKNPSYTQLRHNDMHRYSFFLIVIAAMTLRAQTGLSGTIGGITLEMTGNPYVINENITIPAGKKVTIHEGCIFLFKPFSGIIVEGSIEVLGSEGKPVIFTSINDPQFNSQSTQSPEAFDWNGITISVQARDIQLSNFKLMYSVYGLKAQVEDIKVKSGLFSNNGQFHFTVKDAIQPVTETIPFSYGIALIVSDTPQSTPKEKKTSRRVLSIVLLTTGAAGFGGMGYSLYQIPQYDKKYDNASTQAQRNNYYDKQLFFRNTAIASGAAGVTLASVGLFFFLINNYDDTHMSLIPYHPEKDYSGICITLQF